METLSSIAEVLNHEKMLLEFAERNNLVLVITKYPRHDYSALFQDSMIVNFDGSLTCSGGYGKTTGDAMKNFSKMLYGKRLVINHLEPSMRETGKY